MFEVLSFYLMIAVIVFIAEVFNTWVSPDGKDAWISGESIWENALFMFVLLLRGLFWGGLFIDPVCRRQIFGDMSQKF